MGYKIEDKYREVEVREIPLGGYFEWGSDVYQRFGVSTNFKLQPNPYEPCPIYAVCLTNSLITYFSADGKTKVAQLYEKSPLVLTRYDT